MSDRATERRMLQALAAVLDVRWAKDTHGNVSIEGRLGRFFAASPETGYSIYVRSTGRAGLQDTLKRLKPIATPIRTGDFNATLILRRLPNAKEAAILRRVLWIDRQPHCSGAEYAKKMELIEFAKRASTWANGQTAPKAMP
jgi:hypothetical protein